MAESDNYSNLDNNNIGNVTEFNNDVYVYGTLYADLFGNTSIEGGLNLDVNNLFVTGIATFMDDVFITNGAEAYADYLTVKHRFNVGSAGTGNPFFTTDTAAVLRASEVGAEIVIKATKTNGVYDKDPILNSDAVLYKKLNYDEVLNQNLRVMDATAIAFCRDNQLPIIVLDYREPDSILKAVCGKTIGTLIS